MVCRGSKQRLRKLPIGIEGNPLTHTKLNQLLGAGEFTKGMICVAMLSPQDCGNIG